MTLNGETGHVVKHAVNKGGEKDVPTTEGHDLRDG
jgi:hypothetical protein